MEKPKTERRFLNTIYGESSIDAEILPAVTALRNAGVETIASKSGIGEIGVEDAWGSYVQIILPSENNLEVARKIAEFAVKLTSELQKELNNPAISLQLVSAEKWREDTKTISMEISLIPVYRLQLTGHVNEEEIRYVWSAVSKRFNRQIIE